MSVYTQQPVSGSVIVPFKEAVRSAVIAKYPNMHGLIIDDKTMAEAVSVVSYSLRHFGDPKPTIKILTDVRAKEYTNCGAEPDTVEMSMCKKRDSCLGVGFRFCLLQGVQLDDDDRIGPSIFNSLGKNADMLLMFKEDDHISEKAVVSPGVKMLNTVKTNLVRYEGEASIDVQAPADFSIKLKYYGTYCCGVLRKWYDGTVTMEEVFTGQPDFRRNGGSVFYTAKYQYSYFGEQFEVNKTEQKLDLMC